jgi:eukaryotic-like serine/threonine-protein kinase
VPTVPGLTGLAVLARGGYATVYRATQESVGRDVAVKVENRTLENDRDRRRFLREARAAGRMSSHPHVVDLFDAGVTAEGHPYLIMELCEGSYAERMRTEPLSPAEVRDVGMKIADALADAHSLGVLHRDVKPANLLTTRFGEPALADFGLAILAESRDVSITLDVLTPAYAPPEMFRHAPPSPSADVYALCATLYALLNGKPPRWRDERMPSLVSLVDMFAQPIPDLPGVPPELLALLRAGMANDEHVRPTAIQLRDALQALPLGPAPAGPVLIPPLGSPPIEPIFRPSSADEETVPHGPGLPAYRPPTPDPASAGAPSSVSGRRALWVSVVAGMVGFLALAAIFVAYGPGRPHPNPSRTPEALSTSTSADPSSSPGKSSAPPSGRPAPAPISATPCRAGVPHLANAKCPTTAECYDAAKKPAACSGRHTWEVFAYADLRASANVTNPQDGARSPEIRDVCDSTNLVVLDKVDPFDWTVEILAPSAEDLRAGRRTYRCLAGKGANALNGQTLARP